MSSDDVYFIDADPGTRRKPAGGQTPVPSRKSPFARGGPDATLVGAAPGGAARAWIAASLSLVVCGAGQLFNRRPQLALLYFLTETLALSVNWFLWKVWKPLVDLLGLWDIRPLDLKLAVAAGNYLFLLFVVGNALQAFRDAAGDDPAPGPRVPILSALASLLLPGWGQFLNGQPRKAALLLGLFVSCLYAFAVSYFLPDLWSLWDSSQQSVFDWVLSNGGITALLIALVVYLVAFYDGLLVARRQRSQTL
jgi:TM2 domain-containing membrane protein YozV